LVIDIDNFKKVNDTLGHEMGDTVLVMVAQTITHCARGSDLTARFGGEEFVIALFSAALESAELFAERLRGDIEKKTISSNAGSKNITVSIGLTVWQSNSDAGFDEVFRRADGALYQAKERGKNQVVSA